MDHKQLPDEHAPGPDPGSRTAAFRRQLKTAKAVKAVVVLVVLVLGTVLPLAGVGLPSIGLGSFDLPWIDLRRSFGFVDDVTDTDLPGWADRVLEVLKKVKNGVVALLVIAAVLGERERRRRTPAADRADRADRADTSHDSDDADQDDCDDEGTRIS